MESSEINRCVAAKFGYRCYRVTSGHGKVWFEWVKEGFDRDQFLSIYCGESGFGDAEEVSAPSGPLMVKSRLPDYCNDPLAADALRLEIERREWGILTDNNIGNIPDKEGADWCQSSDRRGYIVSIYHGAELPVTKHSFNSPHEALALAFVAACDAEGGNP